MPASGAPHGTVCHDDGNNPPASIRSASKVKTTRSVGCAPVLSHRRRASPFKSQKAHKSLLQVTDGEPVRPEIILVENKRHCHYLDKFANESNVTDLGFDVVLRLVVE